MYYYISLYNSEYFKNIISYLLVAILFGVLEFRKAGKFFSFLSFPYPLQSVKIRFIDVYIIACFNYIN